MVSEIKINYGDLGLVPIDDMDIFQQSKIYGTVNDPLFEVSLIKKLLGVPIELDAYENMFHFKQIVTTGGNKILVFTEAGLYETLFKSDLEIAKNFRKFVYCVLKELRIKGEVKLDSALKKYVKVKKELYSLSDDLYEQKELVKCIQDDRDVYRDECIDLSYKLGNINKTILSNMRDYNSDNFARTIDTVIRATGKKIYLFNETDTNRWSIKTKENKDHPSELTYLRSDYKIKDIQDILERRGYVRKNFKYDIDIYILRSIIYEMNVSEK